MKTCWKPLRYWRTLYYLMLKFYDSDLKCPIKLSSINNHQLIHSKKCRIFFKKSKHYAKMYQLSCLLIFGAMRQVGFLLVVSALLYFVVCSTSISHSAPIVHISHFMHQECCDSSWMSQYVVLIYFKKGLKYWHKQQLVIQIS